MLSWSRRSWEQTGGVGGGWGLPRIWKIPLWHHTVDLGNAKAALSPFPGYLLLAKRCVSLSEITGFAWDLKMSCICCACICTRASSGACLHPRQQSEKNRTKQKKGLSEWLACLFTVSIRSAGSWIFPHVSPFKWECAHSFAPTVSSCVVVLSVAFANWQKSSGEHLIHQWLICNKLFIAQYLIYAQI